MNTKLWKTVFSITVFLIGLGFQNLQAADWPAFRGAGGDGIAGGSAPVEWDAEKNVAWKVPLPQPSNGSPIVAAGRVFVTSTEDTAGKERSTYCFDAKSGKQLWVKTVDFDQEFPHH